MPAHKCMACGTELFSTQWRFCSSKCLREFQQAHAENQKFFALTEAEKVAYLQAEEHQVLERNTRCI